MHHGTEPIPLSTGYSPLFVKASGNREHLVELHVTGPDDPGRCSTATPEPYVR
ncbi:hypothetical protein [Streptomyces sp. UG1]|uniref:hypothetical protein n=1 Tax=Streptomyces sp. UG1 TaxID=3417652 RepID=UPI003CEC5F59